VDLHIHYNAWVAASLTPEEVARQLREHGAIGGVVSSTPTPNALRLATQAPGVLVPFFRPYLTERHRGSWHQDPAVLAEAEAALKAGQYRGIGEVHLSTGNAGADAGNTILRGLLDLARHHRVPIQVHVDEPHIPVLEALLAAHPAVTVIWAHAGGWAEPSQVEALLVAHPNLWVEFSARDPFRYGGVGPLVDATGRLLPYWASLAHRFRDRLMVGSDTGSMADWDRLGELYAFHRTWLAGLPRDIAEAIAFRNAARLLGLRLPATGPQP
jgi:predicted TIM-barrel fold metal-dependent hydrolase